MLIAQAHVKDNLGRTLNNGHTYRNTNPGAFF